MISDQIIRELIQSVEALVKSIDKLTQSNINLERKIGRVSGPQPWAKQDTRLSRRSFPGTEKGFTNRFEKVHKRR